MTTSRILEFKHEVLDRYREQKEMADDALARCDDQMFFARLRADGDDHTNSIAILVKHIGGNFRSRWTDFLTTDGEKPDRQREREFIQGDVDSRTMIMQRWEEGWQILFATLEALTEADFDRTVTIRGEPHTVLHAIGRNLTHAVHHIGQIDLLANSVEKRIETMNRIGIGIIGGGGIAAEGHICGYQLDPRCEVVALWDNDEARVREQAQRLGVARICTSFAELLDRDDIQAVSVCTPDHLHGEHAHAALRAGKHVLCEKPMTTTRADAARLVQDVRETGLVFLGGQITHHQPDHQAMVAAYRAGELGEIWLAESDYISDMRRYYGPKGETPWRTDSKAPQDILLGGGCHSVGILMWALETRVKQVFAYANHKAEPTLPINDCYLVSLHFENGTIGKLIAASGNRGGAPTGGRLVLYGTEGTLWGGKLYRNNRETKKSEVIRDFREEFKDHKPRVQGVRMPQHWAEQCEHFLDCIEGKAQPLTSVEEGARIVAALCAAIESSRTGLPVDVDNEF